MGIVLYHISGIFGAIFMLSGFIGMGLNIYFIFALNRRLDPLYRRDCMRGVDMMPAGAFFRAGVYAICVVKKSYAIKNFGEEVPDLGKKLTWLSHIFVWIIFVAIASCLLSLSLHPFIPDEILQHRR